MSDSHINQLAKIDALRQLINEERLTLLNERQALITQYELELAQLSASQTPTPISRVPEIPFIHIILLPLFSKVLNPLPPVA